MSPQQRILWWLSRDINTWFWIQRGQTSHSVSTTGLPHLLFLHLWIQPQTKNNKILPVLNIYRLFLDFIPIAICSRNYWQLSGKMWPVSDIGMHKERGGGISPGTCVPRLLLLTSGPQCPAETKRACPVLTTVSFSSWLGAREPYCTCFRYSWNLSSGNRPMTKQKCLDAFQSTQVNNLEKHSNFEQS